MTHGKFITLEGGEGAGKSTQVSLLAEALRASGLNVHTTREPGGSPGAEDIRKLLVVGDAGRWDALSEAFLHFAARRDHVQKTILPNLEEGTWVLSDRFLDSTMAYQGYAQGLGRDAIETLAKLTLGDFLPDMTLILDLDVETGLARAAARHDGEDRYERLGTAFHNSLRDAFRDIAQREPERCVAIDANGDINAVQTALRAAVATRFGLSL